MIAERTSRPRKLTLRLLKLERKTQLGANSHHCLGAVRNKERTAALTVV